MGGGEGAKGPDLRQGVPSSAVGERGSLVGMVDGEAVLLARIDGEVFGIAATCTHYSGPLGEGLLVDGTVRCPWHHACFDLRTGEALRTPALNDVARFTVEERDGTIRVTGKHEPDRDRRAASRTPPTSPSSVVIIGAGAAGNAAAEQLRREGYAGPVVLIDDDDDAPYDRPNLSKDYLAGTAPEEWIALHPPEFYDEQRIERVGTRVTAIDTTAKTVALADGSRRSYGALLLATGAEPVRLDVPTEAGARVFYLRSLSNSRAIIEAAGAAGRAVVIGASFIGLEVAASLRHRGLEVDVVAPENRPLGKVLGEPLGDFVRALHERHGVRFHLGRTTRSIGRDEVVLDDGARLPADIVVIGIGVRPRVELARQAGLDVENGVLVDARMRTSAPGVFAAGDIARWPDPHTGEPIRVEHWVLAERLGQAAARNMLGHDSPYRQAPFFWSQHYDATIAYVGHAARWDDIHVDGDPNALDCTVTYRRDGRRLAVATIFRDVESLRAELEMEREAAEA